MRYIRNGIGGSNPPPTAFKIIMINFFKKKEKKEPTDLKEVISYIKELEENIENISTGLQNLKQMAINSMQKIGVVRYNPFGNVGGDQSFSIAVLDANNSGFIISSLYLREGTKVYAKPIKNGKTEYALSEEELEAIEKAIKS